MTLEETDRVLLEWMRSGVVYTALGDAIGDGAGGMMTLEETMRFQGHYVTRDGMSMNVQPSRHSAEHTPGRMVLSMHHEICC